MWTPVLVVSVIYWIGLGNGHFIPGGNGWAGHNSIGNGRIVRGNFGNRHFVPGNVGNRRVVNNNIGNRHIVQGNIGGRRVYPGNVGLPGNPNVPHVNIVNRQTVHNNFGNRRVYPGNVGIPGNPNVPHASVGNRLVYAGNVGLPGNPNVPHNNIGNRRVYPGNVGLPGNPNVPHVNIGNRRVYPGNVGLPGNPNVPHSNIRNRRIYPGNVGLPGNPNVPNANQGNRRFAHGHVGNRRFQNNLANTQIRNGGLRNGQNMQRQVVRGQMGIGNLGNRMPNRINMGRRQNLLCIENQRNGMRNIGNRHLTRSNVGYVPGNLAYPHGRKFPSQRIRNGIRRCKTDNEWTYQGFLGPSHWPRDFPQCAGYHQSPINIDTTQLHLDMSMANFNLTELKYTERINMLLENVKGHTVEVQLGGSEIAVSGGGLEGSYGVEQFHFHWGAKDMRGSEHTINHNHFPMEMHIVMYSHKYPNFKTALKFRHGLAVLGFFFKVGKTNPVLEELLTHFYQIEHSGETIPIPTTFPIFSLLPRNLNAFYRYDGSLTTPPCSETVVWTLFAEPIEVSEVQLEKFRHVKRTHKGELDRYLIDDFRPVQPLNNRIVRTSYVR